MCKNIGELLAAAGTNYDKVIKTTCFLADMETLVRLTRCMQNISHPNQPEAVWL